MEPGRGFLGSLHVLPGLSILGIIIIVLLLTVVLNYGLFKPVTRILDQREQAIKSASEAARAAAARADAAAAEFERRTRDAQTEVYRVMEEHRREALQRRTDLLAQTRQDVDRSLAEASRSLQTQATEARAQLEKDADTLAEAVVERVLGRRAS
jgi:F-type H+-transporting ATPase subunit b